MVVMTEDVISPKGYDKKYGSIHNIWFVWKLVSSISI